MSGKAYEAALRRQEMGTTAVIVLVLISPFLARDSLRQPPLEFLRPRWTVAAEEVGATQEGDLRPRGWGMDGCGTAEPLDIDLFHSLRAETDYEVRGVRDHPITIVTRTGFNRHEEASPITQSLWATIQECAAADPGSARIDFEVLGTAPDPDSATAVFGWRAIVRGPWRAAYDPGREPVAPGFTSRAGAEVWHLEMWFTLVDGDLLVVAGAEGREAPELDARELLDTVTERLNENMPERQVYENE